MGFASIIPEPEEDGYKRYLLLFESLREFEDEEYIRFKNDFNELFTLENTEENKEMIIKIDTRNIETIPFSILYDFSHNLLDIKPRAEGILKKTIIIVSRQLVINAFKVLFMICSPISEIEYVLE
tara:strand:+ start:4577 stop:4951 length:375 start_codon:yes stop_codon:yes gene_type:complete